MCLRLIVVKRVREMVFLLAGVDGILRIALRVVSAVLRGLEPGTKPRMMLVWSWKLVAIGVHLTL